MRRTRERAISSSVAKPTPSERCATESPARRHAGRSAGASPGFSGGSVHFVHVSSVIVELWWNAGSENRNWGEEGRSVDARHYEVGRDKPTMVDVPRRKEGP